MNLWAIVPVKSFELGKSRLSAILTDGQRAELNRRMLIHTLSTLAAVAEIRGVLVISRDPSALSLAQAYGARWVREWNRSGLNPALVYATLAARSCGADGVLILPADLPLVTPEDVRGILEKAYDPPVVVVAPDRHGKGTNALLVCPVGLIEYSFGVDSFRRHCQRAFQAKARLEVCESPSLAFDVDFPEDLGAIKETAEEWIRLET